MPSAMASESGAQSKVTMIIIFASPTSRARLDQLYAARTLEVSRDRSLRASGTGWIGLERRSLRHRSRWRGRLAACSMSVMALHDSSMKAFHFPDLGEGLHEAQVVEWHVAEGD